MAMRTLPRDSPGDGGETGEDKIKSSLKYSWAMRGLRVQGEGPNCVSHGEQSVGKKKSLATSMAPNLEHSGVVCKKVL